MTVVIVVAMIWLLISILFGLWFGQMAKGN